MHLNKILQNAVQKKATDIFIMSGLALAFRINTEIAYTEGKPLNPIEVEKLVGELYSNTIKKNVGELRKIGDDNFSFTIHNMGWFRANVALHKGVLGAVIRVLPSFVPQYKEINIPENIMQTTLPQKGLALVVGAAGSGKTTTLACIIDKINSESAKHIITIEDPIEHLHEHKKSIVTQREIGVDIDSYENGIKAALRQSPDVILIGEMRSAETMSVAMSAAETGQLVFSTLHTSSAASAVDRIINSFSADKQQQVRFQLSMVLQAVISQQLIPGINEEVVPAFEVLLVTPAVRHMIRDGKTHQIDSIIFSGRRSGMQTMDSNILSLYEEGKISLDNAIQYSSNPNEIIQKIA